MHDLIFLMNDYGIKFDFNFDSLILRKQKNTWPIRFVDSVSTPEGFESSAVSIPFRMMSTEWVLLVVFVYLFCKNVAL